MKFSFFPKLNVITTTFLLLALVGVGAGAYFYYQNQQLRANPEQVTQEETKALIGKVGQLIELPKEEPTIATVTDKDKLKDQPFFQKAENGDKVLIYTQAKRAILYRPSVNRVIDVAPVNIGTGSATESATIKQEVIKVALYNGTTIVGLTNTAEKDLKGKISNIEIVTKENAQKEDYEKTMVIVLVQGREQEAKKLAETLKAQISPLPEGETKPAEAEILVILGSDYNQK